MSLRRRAPRASRMTNRHESCRLLGFSGETTTTINTRAAVNTCNYRSLEIVWLNFAQILQNATCGQTFLWTFNPLSSDSDRIKFLLITSNYVYIII